MVRPEPLLEPGLPGWRMAGAGDFREVEPGTIESYGGSGIFWYTAKAYADFDLACSGAFTTRMTIPVSFCAFRRWRTILDLPSNVDTRSRSMSGE